MRHQQTINHQHQQLQVHPHAKNVQQHHYHHRRQDGRLLGLSYQQQQHYWNPHVLPSLQQQGTPRQSRNDSSSEMSISRSNSSASFSHSLNSSDNFSADTGGERATSAEDEWPEGASQWYFYCQHVRLKGQTSNPDALLWDKAVDSFRWGVQQTRAGHVLEGAVAICTSILLDARAYKACRRLPPCADDMDKQKMAKNCLLDEGVAQTMVQHQKSHVLIQLCVSMIAAMGTEQWKGSGCSSSRKHTTTSQAQQVLRMIDTTKNILVKRPHVLTAIKEWGMDKWHYWWAMRYLAAGGQDGLYWREALVELSKALEYNPLHVRARYQTALLYSQYSNNSADSKMTTTALCHAWKNYIQVAHPDDYYLHDAYTWMAYLVMADKNKSNSRSIQDEDDNDVIFTKASGYLEASDRAFVRHASLYGFANRQEQSLRWYSSDHNGTSTATSAHKAKTLARLRSHPKQRVHVKVWTVEPPSC